MNSIKVFVETGKKKIFVGAVDWNGWVTLSGCGSCHFGDHF